VKFGRHLGDEKNRAVIEFLLDSLGATDGHRYTQI
jgi:hypothetical protein